MLIVRLMLILQQHMRIVIELCMLSGNYALQSACYLLPVYVGRDMLSAM